MQQMPPSFGPAALVTAEYHAPTGHADRPGVPIKPQQNYVGTMVKPIHFVH